MLYLILISVTMTIISFIANKDKTITGLQTAWKRIKTMVPPLMIMISAVSLVLYLLPLLDINKYLVNAAQLRTTLVASLLGSITVMSGFIAFPLCGILRDQGVSYMTISAFSTSLMMVGILSFPIERHFFGFRLSLIRNSMYYLICLIIALITGILYGEILL